MQGKSAEKNGRENDRTDGDGCRFVEGPDRLCQPADREDRDGKPVEECGRAFRPFVADQALAAALRSATLGPLPFSGRKITPAASRAVRMVERVRG